METKPYILITEITMRGVLLPAGTTVHVDERKAEWLHDQGAIVLAGRKPIATAPRTFATAPITAPRSSSRGCCGPGWR